MFSSSTRSLTRWILVLPVLMVGSMLYWSLALMLGVVSLGVASNLSGGPGIAETAGIGGAMSESADIVDGMGGPSGSIFIHLEESVEPEDVNDNAGAGYLAPSDSGP